MCAHSAATQDLPSPQVSDQELEEIAKLNASTQPMRDDDEDAPTRMLLPSYAPTPLIGGGTAGGRGGSTPLMRTPAREDRIRLEAENVSEQNEKEWCVRVNV